MSHLTVILWICSAVSAVVLCWLIFAAFMAGIILGGEHLRITKGIARALAMTLIWLAVGLGLHWGMLNSPAFRASVPFFMLKADVASPRYGREALSELQRRALSESIGPAECATVTDSLLTHSWWHTAVAFDSSEPGNLWLVTMFKSYRLSNEQMTRWMEVAPPPILSLAPQPRGEGAAETDPPSAYVLRAAFGRSWVRNNGVPYDIEAVRVDEILVNGQAVALTPVITGVPDPALGHFADSVLFEFRDLPAVPAEVRVRFHVDVADGAYVNLGPLTWVGRIEL